MNKWNCHGLKRKFIPKYHREESSINAAKDRKGIIERRKTKTEKMNALANYIGDDTFIYNWVVMSDDYGGINQLRNMGAKSTQYFILHPSQVTTLVPQIEHANRVLTELITEAKLIYPTIFLWLSLSGGRPEVGYWIRFISPQFDSSGTPTLKAAAFIKKNVQFTFRMQTTYEMKSTHDHNETKSPKGTLPVAQDQCLQNLMSKIPTILFLLEIH